MKERAKDGYEEKQRLGFFDQDGTAVMLLTKTGELVILSFMWLIASLPIVTIGAASSALYYSVVKSIRKSRGYPAKEFINAFKACIKNATYITLIGLMWGVAIFKLIDVAAAMKNTHGSFLMRVYTVLAALSIGFLIYAFPVISRFKLEFKKIMELTFVIMVRNIHYTLLMLILAGGIIWIFLFRLPMVLMVFLPSLWTLFISFPIEKAMRKYMPDPKKEDKDKWYYV
ncbi:MAG: DUF624 domain-containing protein [Lachnospiraceae bacterium]|nr:DUF624 domain-containing protein [Lachnospiraceae bacterium]